MSDDEINVLLHRFDQTEPQLQRRIVAALAEKAALFEPMLGIVKGQGALLVAYRTGSHPPDKAFKLLANKEEILERAKEAAERKW